MVGDAIIGESLSPPIGASGCCLNRIGLGRNSGGFQELANLHHLRLQQAVASEVQNHRASVQCDAEPALRFGVDFRAKPIENIHYVLHFEIGIERMGEDRVENFALMVIYDGPR